MRRSVILSAAGILAAAAGHADEGTADAPVRAQLPPASQLGPAAPRAYTERWVGIYGGASLGYGDADLGTRSDSGAGLGGHLGFNMEFGNVLVGGEGERVWVTNSGLDHITRGKLRAGFARGAWMFHGAAGLAHVSGSAGSDAGYTLGGGVTHALDGNWRIGGELLYDRVNGFDDGNDLEHISVNIRASYAF